MKTEVLIGDIRYCEIVGERYRVERKLKGKSYKIKWLTYYTEKMISEFNEDTLNMDKLICREGKLSILLYG